MRKGFMERSLLLRQSSTLGGSRAESGGGLVWRSREKAQKGNWFLRAPGILCGHWREAGATHRGWLKPESTVNRENAPDREKAPGFKNPLGNVGEGGACGAPALGDDVIAERKPALEARTRAHRSSIAQ